MQLFENYPLEDKHTFHIPVKTRYWGTFDSVEDLKNLLQEATRQKLPIFLLGSGSNVLFTADYPGMILQAGLKESEVIGEEEQSVLVKAGSGIIWMIWSVKGYMRMGGAEIFVSIPGTVCATPI